MQRELQRVRPFFQYHADPSRASAVRQLVRDLCTPPNISGSLASAISQRRHLEDVRIPRGRQRPPLGESSYVGPHAGYPSRAEMYEARLRSLSDQVVGAAGARA